MSFKDILSTIAGLLEGKSSAEIEDTISAIYDLTNNKKTQPRKTQPRKTKPRQPNRQLQSTLPIEDWLSVASCATWITEKGGRHTTPDEIMRLIDENKVDVLDTWCKHTPCVHKRQVARYLDSGDSLDVFPFIVNARDWAPMTQAAELFPITVGAIASAVRSKRIACHQADAQCKVVNLSECSKLWG